VDPRKLLPPDGEYAWHGHRFPSARTQPLGLKENLEHLPSSKTVEAYLIAANESGEAEQTPTVSAVVG